jgi:predicted transcriptional regulator
MPGKMDWLAYGLPMEKKPRGVTMLVEHLQKEFPIARLNDPAGDVQLRLEQAGSRMCPVLSEDGVLLGVFAPLNGSIEPSTPVKNVMDPAPTTVRPSVSIDNAIKQLAKNKAEELLVTSSDGKLLGMFRCPKTLKHDLLQKSASRNDEQ